MISPRYLGVVSLGAAAAGSLTLEVLLRTGTVAGPFWRVAAMGAESAMVGGMADWYAVRVLFHKAPFPLSYLPPFSTHQEIVVKNRTRIAKQIVEMVEKRWLSKEAIAQGLAGISLSDKVLNWCSEAEHRREILERLRGVLKSMVTQLDRPELSLFLDQALREQVGKANLAQALGDWLKRSLDRGTHQPFLDELVKALIGGLKGAELKAEIQVLIRKTAGEYAAQHTGGSTGKAVLEYFGYLDYEAMADEILNGIQGYVGAIRKAPNHPLRLRIETALREYADLLLQGDPQSTKRLAAITGRIVESVDLRQAIQSILGHLKAELSQTLEDADGRLMRAADGLISAWLNALKSNADARAKFDQAAREMLLKVIAGNHHEIGRIVEGSLAPERLSDEALVHELEEKVGNDLQWIQMNGAIMGFLIGILLGAAKAGLG